MAERRRVEFTNGFSASNELKHSPLGQQACLFACSPVRGFVFVFKNQNVEPSKLSLISYWRKNEGSASIIRGDESLQRRIVAASIDDRASLLNVADEKG